MDTFTDACDQMPDDDLDLKKCESTVTMDASHLDTSKVSLDPKFLVRWQNLKVSVPSKHGPRLVLNEVSGQVDNQQITAILGPSGAGKSTLLNCISGQKQSISGQVEFLTSTRETNTATFAYVPQEDHLSPYLTVEETLLLASRLKNHSPDFESHERHVDDFLQDFGLITCRSQLTVRCSGGERKRLSIGCEMISRPSVLLLDEPTSGLDSSTSLKVVEVLSKMRHKTAILTAVHQPSSQLFHLFSQVYVLAAGSCIYFGPPDQMVAHLARHSLHCPLYSNPADFVLAVANRLQQAADRALAKRINYTSTSLYELRETDLTNKKKMTTKSNTKQLLVNLSNDYREQSLRVDTQHKMPTRQVPLSKLHQHAPIWVAYPLLVGMFIRSFIRDPLQAIFRLMNALTLPLLLLMVSQRGMGSERACAFIPMNETHLLPETTYDRLERQELALRNVGLTYLDLMYAYFSGMVPAIIALNVHVNVFRKHLQNGYYGVGVFLLSLFTVCTICTVFLGCINGFTYFYTTGQKYSTSRLIGFTFIVISSALIGEYGGLLLNLLLPSANIPALMFGSAVGFGVYTFSGFFLPIKNMQPWLAYMTEYLFCRHTFEAMLRVMYGSVNLLPVWSAAGNRSSVEIDSDENCLLPNSVGFTFDQLRDLFIFYNHEQAKDDASLDQLPSISLDTFDDIPNKVRVAMKQKLWIRKDILTLAEAMNDLDSEQVNRLDRFWDTKLDLVLGNYNIEPHGIYTNYVVIVLTWFALIFISWIILQLKYKR